MLVSASPTRIDCDFSLDQIRPLHFFRELRLEIALSLVSFEVPHVARSSEYGIEGPVYYQFAQSVDAIVLDKS